MSNISKVKSKAEFIAMLNPKAWDAVFPHSPLRINDHLVELFVADVMKNAALHINDKNLQKQGIALSAKIATKASHGIIGALAADGDDIELCPPWPWPWPGPRFGADPDIMQVTTKLLEQTELVSTLVLLSSLTMEKEFNVELKQLGASVARGFSSAFADEVEKCGTVPRKPWGGPHRIVKDVKTREGVIA